MGISGLLPLLKSIQTEKSLSDYAGQTVAVDAYVWLHKGVFSCAVELATGKKTIKYVDYAMHRVRLLRHFKIVPYIVFDGGPLPAKRGTEQERKKKREECLAKANDLAARGRDKQARDYYVKCVDVTPQMAFQFIKALRAEGVSYVVAPYEADAQMAYLERIGLVSAILTEDSDLLVFGCRHVLFKLDTEANTVKSISRDRFGSVNDPRGISLQGWSDSQFRAMAILSGCDYLPNIQGIGLKTAWTLLKKHRNAENVIRTLKMEGKKDVPPGYLQAFYLAEKVFLHQRVYDPIWGMIVNLTPIPEDEEWDVENEAHVGEYIEPALAKQVAEGDACPITLKAMEDINPTFVPRALKPLRMNATTSREAASKDKGKGKMIVASEKPKSSTLHNFFTPKVKTDKPPRVQPQLQQAQSEPRMSGTMAGRRSGKRTLAEAMDEDTFAKRSRHEQEDQPRRVASCSQIRTSKFFATASIPSPGGRRVPDDVSDTESVAGPSTLCLLREGKENVPCTDEDDIGEISDDEEPNPVTQEDGYMSPSSTFSKWDSPELSSPTRPRASRVGGSLSDDDDFDADVLSSPPSAARRPKSQATPTRSVGRVLVHATPTRRDRDAKAKENGVPGPDLRDVFEDWDEGTSDIDEGGDDSIGSMASSSDPVTPAGSQQPDGQCVDDIFDEVTPDYEDYEEIESQAAAARTERVANGWREKWSCASRASGTQSAKAGSLRRAETTVTPEGRHRPTDPRQPKTRDQPRRHDPRSTGRRSLTSLFHEAKASTSAVHKCDIKARPGSSPSVPEKPEDTVLASAKARLAAFRCIA